MNVTDLKDVENELDRREWDSIDNAYTVDMTYILDKTIGVDICKKCVVETGCSVCEECKWIDQAGDLTMFTKSNFNDGCDE